MKKNLFNAILLLLVAANGFAQANKTLSNLTFPTAVNVDLLPKNSTTNLGSSSKSWENFYLNGSVFLLGFRFISGSNNTGNTFVGIDAGNVVTTGDRDSFFGDAAGLSNTSGANNSFFGQDAGFSTNTGSHNSFFGESAGFRNTGGNSNSFFGKEAGVNNASGSFNVFVGNNAGSANTNGDKNTYVGYHAGNTGTTGSSNTIIGYGADLSNSSFKNATAIGNLAIVGASNHIHIGNSSVTSIGGQVGWTNFSDERIKNNIKENVPGLAFINLLTPVTYHFDLNREENVSGRKTDDWNGKYDIQNIQFTGFIAQDVEKAAKQIGYDFSGIDVPQNDKDIYGLRYADFVVPLVKAVQELSQQNDSLKNQNTSQQIQINKLQKQMDEIKRMLSTQISSTANGQPQTINISSASLQ